MCFVKNSRRKKSNSREYVHLHSQLHSYVISLLDSIALPNSIAKNARKIVGLTWIKVKMGMKWRASVTSQSVKKCYKTTFKTAFVFKTGTIVSEASTGRAQLRPPEQHWIKEKDSCEAATAQSELVLAMTESWELRLSSLAPSRAGKERERTGPVCTLITPCTFTYIR